MAGSLEGITVSISVEIVGWFQVEVPITDVNVVVGDGVELSMPIAYRVLSDTDGDGDVEPVQGPNGLLNGTVTVDISGNEVFAQFSGLANPAGFKIVVSDLQPSDAVAPGTITDAGGFSGVNAIYAPTYDVSAKALTFNWVLLGFQPGTTINQTVFYDNQLLDAPVAGDDSFGTLSDTILTGVNVLDNDTDLDNSGAIGLVDPSTVTLINGSAGNVGQWIDLAGGGRALVHADGSVEFDPDGDFDYLPAGATAATSFTYQATDSAGLNDTATATITVTGVNTAPEITLIDAALAVDENQAAATQARLSVSDAEGDSQTVTLSVAKGTLTIAAAGLSVAAGDGTADTTMTFSGTLADINAALGTLTYTPAADATGADTIQISVNDGQGGVTSSSIPVTIADIAPVLDDRQASLPEMSPDGTPVLTMAATGDTNGLTWSIVAGNTGGAFSIDAATGAITVADGSLLDFEGPNQSYALTVAVDDEDADGAADSSATVTVSLTDANDAPVFEAGLADGDETITFAEHSTNGTVILDVDAWDGDGGSTDSGLTYSIAAGNLDVDGDGEFAFAIDAATGQITVNDADDLDFEGVGSFDLTVQADDGGAVRNVSTAAVTVNLTDTAETYVVTTATDEEYGGGSLADELADGDGLSLREAMGLANAGLATADTIRFDAGLAGETITLGFGALRILSDLTIDGDIDGDGAADITVDASGSSRVFWADHGGTSTIDALAITGGVGFEGGGVLVSSGSTLTIVNSEIYGNEAFLGAGLYNSGTLTVVNSSITGNSAEIGGGLLNETGRTVAVINSTISGNTAIYGGGAAFLSGIANLTNVTITGNAVIAAGEGPPVGGIVVGISGTVTLTNSIVAGNAFGSTPTDIELSSLSTLIRTGSNIVGGDLFQDNNDIGDVTLEDIFETVGADPNTGATSGLLDDNGGPVRTVLIRDYGPAHNGGSNAVLIADMLDLDGDGDTAELLPLDARGLARIFDGTVDLGAVELQVAINDAPALTGDLEADVDEGGSVTIAAADLGFADPDDAAAEVTFTVSNRVNGTILVGGAAATSFTGAQLAAGEVSFLHDGSETTAASFDILVEDGDEDGSTPVAETFDLMVGPVNDAPVNTVPGAQTVAEDTPLLFSAANGNAIAIADADVGSSEVLVTLSVDSGLLSLAGAGGLTFVTGDGTGDATMSFRGTIADINAALDGLAFAPEAGASGGVTLTVTTDDQGLAGSGGARTDADTVAIDVTEVNDAPVNTVPGAQTVAEDTPLVFSAANGNTITIADIDAGAGEVLVTLSVDSGLLSLAGTGGLTFVTGDGTGDATVSFRGTIADINAALDGLVFTPNTDASGGTTLTVTTDDQGLAGSGGALSDTDTVAIDVTEVNDAPVNTVPGAQTVAEDTPLVFSAANGNAIAIADADVGSSEVLVTLSVDSGLLFLAGTGGLTFVTGDGTGDATMSFRGTIADINAALDGLAFAPEAGASGGVTLTVTTDDQGLAGSGGALSDADTVAIDVTEVNDAPELEPRGVITVLEGGTETLSIDALGYADADDVADAAVFTVDDVANGAVLVNGVEATSFTGAQLAAGQVSFRHDGSETTAASFDITVDDGSATASEAYELVVVPVNDAPTALDFSRIVSSVPEDVSTAKRIRVADLAITDADGGDNTLRLAGRDAGKFEIAAGKLFLKNGATLDFEARDELRVHVLVDDPTIDGSAAELRETFTLAVTDVDETVNEPPTVKLRKKVTSLSEDTSTAKARKVATIVVKDDGLGEANLSLSGADRKLFQIKDGKLFLKKGVDLDADANPKLDVTVRVDDPATKGIDDKASLSIRVTAAGDLHIGTPERDRMKGDGGDETFLGRGDDDRIKGKGGDDRIDGEGGDDRLFGNGGADVLIGGPGTDKMTGGAGEDTFLFRKVTESGNGFSGFINNHALGIISGQGHRDIITDFHQDEDVIDLSAIDANTKKDGDQAFKWKADGSFTGKPRELVFRQYDLAGSKNDVTVVYADVDGNAKSDFQIELAGLIDLTKGDFIL